MAGEPEGELLRAGLLGADPQRQGLQAAVQQVRAERVQDGPGDGADLAQPDGPVGVAGDDAGEHVAVAADALGGAVQDERRAVPGRLLEHGVATVLSTSSGTSPAAVASAAMSTRSRVGLAGVSTMTSAVSGRTAAPTSSGRAQVTSVPSRPVASTWSVPP